mgnify:CR=1 FL=1
MKLKATLIKKPNIDDIIKLSVVFNLETPINIENYNNIIKN